MDELKGKIIHYGPWQIPIAAKHVMCSDGRRRYVRLTSEPDTFFSIPGTVQVKGKSVSGFISARDGDPEDLEFHAYTYRKNGHLLP